MSVRKALWKYLFEPIGVEPDTLDVFRTSPLEAKRVPFNYLLPTGEYIPSPVPFDTPQYEDDGPNGAVTSASAPLWGQMPAYAKVMQTLLDPEGPKDKRTGKPLFSKALWDDISCDNLARHYSLNIKQPGFAESANPGLAASIDWWQKPKNEGDDSSLGWSALQTLVIRNETETGLKPGTLTWCGLANTVSLGFSCVLFGHGRRTLAETRTRQLSTTSSTANEASEVLLRRSCSRGAHLRCSKSGTSLSAGAAPTLPRIRPLDPPGNKFRKPEYRFILSSEYCVIQI